MIHKIHINILIFLYCDTDVYTRSVATISYMLCYLCGFCVNTAMYSLFLFVWVLCEYSYVQFVPICVGSV